MRIKHKGLRRLYERNDARSLHAAHVTRIRRILYMLRSARQPHDMDQPGFRLHPLRGEYQGHWSVAVSGNWRICRWRAPGRGRSSAARKGSGAMDLEARRSDSLSS